MRGEEASLYQKASIWNEWIADKEDHKISLRKAIDTTDEYFFDCLLESDTEILDEVFSTFGNYKPFALVEYTHNPKHSRVGRSTRQKQAYLFENTPCEFRQNRKHIRTIAETMSTFGLEHEKEHSLRLLLPKNSLGTK